MKRLLLFILLTAHVHAQRVAIPNGASLGESEAQKIEDRIATVRRDLLSKYESQLGELQLQLQKIADLEGALATRDERTRVHAEQTLSDSNFAKEPKSLRTLQQTTLTKMNDLVSGVVTESLPKLIELKKQLTVDGRLDDAIAVRQCIERLQNANVPIVRADPGGIVPSETLLRAYAADRSRADRTYKGVRIAVRGVMAGYKLDPENGKTLLVYLSGGTTSGWVLCSFNLAQWRYREDRAGAGIVLVLIPKDGSEVRMTKGAQVDILGDCTGWDDMVKLAKCDVPR
ncbi:MAG: hypothetical protein ABIP20_07515 [Chthoniobacteraceae bacterium]